MADILTLGPELIVNGTFETDTSGWLVVLGGTLTNPGGVLRVTNGEVNKGAAFSETPMTLGPGEYLFKAEGDVGTGGGFVIQVKDEAVMTYVNITSQVSGGFSEEFTVSTSDDVGVLLSNESSNIGEYAEFDNISLRQILARKRGGALPAERFPRRVRLGSKTYVVRDKWELDRLIRKHHAEGDL